MTDPLKGWPHDHGKKPRTGVEPTTGVYLCPSHAQSLKYRPNEDSHHAFSRSESPRSCSLATPAAGEVAGEEGGQGREAGGQGREPGGQGREAGGQGREAGGQGREAGGQGREPRDSSHGSSGTDTETR